MKSGDIEYLRGDATDPVSRPAMIVHICNDIGAWGKGFVLALSRRWPEPEARYREWHAAGDRFSLGEVQIVDVEQDIAVANMIAQRGIRTSHGVAPIRYDATEQALGRVAKVALERGAGLDMPRIGCGLAGGTWDEIEPIVRRTCVSQGLPVTVYDWP